jgi:hypothetical protein
MIDELCPIQFIEGINEWTPEKINFFDSSPLQPIAIKYQPKFSYTLSKLHIYLRSIMESKQSEIKVAIHSNNNDKPSDIILSEGSLNLTLSKGMPESPWQEINLKPVVVFRNNIYWLVLQMGGYWQLVQNGESNAIECHLKTTKGITWEVIKPNPKIMFRFYGRALTLSTSIYY